MKMVDCKLSCIVLGDTFVLLTQSYEICYLTFCSWLAVTIPQCPLMVYETSTKFLLKL